MKDLPLDCWSLVCLAQAFSKKSVCIQLDEGDGEQEFLHQFKGLIWVKTKNRPT